MVNEQIFINSWEEEKEVNGHLIKIKMNWTIFYHVGVTFETIEGPFAGSAYFI
jgi:hypothetical protein